MDFSQGAAIVATLNGAREIVRGLINQRDAQKLSSVQSQLTEHIINAQAQLAELLAVLVERTGRIAELEEQVRDLKRDQLERHRYELAELGPRGALAYRLKPAAALSERQSEPPHFVCQPCFDKGVKAVLQFGGAMGIRTFHCPVCNKTFNGGG